MSVPARAYAVPSGFVHAGQRLSALINELAPPGAGTRRYRKGQTLFHQGAAADSLHLVVAGRVAVRLVTETGDLVTVSIVVPGDVLGELALLSPGGRRSATAIALEPVETRMVSRSTFERLRTRPDVSDLVVALLADRVRTLDERLAEALYVPAEIRVLRRLAELTAIFGDVVPLFQEDLANLAGTTRATVNRVLRPHARAGVVGLERGRIVVVDRAVLFQST